MASQPAYRKPDVEEEQQLFPLGDILRIVWKRLWVVVLMAFIIVQAVVGYSFVRPPTYEASILILVGQEKDNDTSDSLGSDVQGLQQITQTMTEAVGTRPVAEAVIRRLDLGVSSEEFLKDRMMAEQVGATQFIEVTYQDTDRRRAWRVANTIGEEFSEQVSEVSTSANDITATVWERAALPEDPVSPNLLLNILAASVVGILFGLGLAFMLEYLDHTWSSPEEVERVTRLPSFGVIPQYAVQEEKASRRKKGR